MIAIGQITIAIVNDGSQGPQGPQGTSVTKVVREYTKSSSSSTLPSNPNWSETEPTIGANEYLWARDRTDLSNGTSTYGPAICSTNISGVKHDVDKANKSITDKVWESDITTKINQYDGSTVSTIRDRLSTTETDISGIKTRVSDVESETSDLGTRMSTAETAIDQTANNVLIKATKSDTTAAQGGQHLIQSLINVAPSGVTISADKVNIEGATIFSSGRLSQTNLNNAYDAKGSAAAVQTNLDNLEIGGRNYYKNYSGTINYYNGGYATKDVSINGVVGNTNTSNNFITVRLNNVITEKGYWTVSGYVKTENAATLSGDICDVSSPYSLATTSDYKFFTFTVNVTREITTTYHFVDINITKNAVNFWLKDIKVEKGNKPTSWTPAPEDQFASTVPCYYRKTTSGAPSAPSSTIGTSNNTDNTWTYVMPLPKKNCYFFTCEEYTNVGGTKSYSTVRALDSQTYTSKWVSSSDQTYIDGGSIYTHSITTNQLATDAIKSTNYLAGGSNSPYSSAGTFLDLSNGNFYTPNFGVQSLTGKAYLNGEIIATSGSIGDDSGNYWEIGNTTDSQGNGSASIVGNGTAYIQDGDWQIHSGLSNYSNGSINTQWYTTPQGGGLQLTYPYYDGYYYDYGMTSPVLDTTSSRFYNQTVSQNFLYIRKHASTIPALESDWNYIFRVDKDGMIWINGQSLTQMIQSGVDGGAYVPTSGGTITGNLTVTGNLTATASKANQLTHSISVNGKAFDGSADVTVGTIGAAYGGTGQTSLKAAGTAIISALDTNTTTPVDNDYIATGSSTFYRKTMSKLWDYIKGKLSADHSSLDSLYVQKSGDTMTGSLTVENSVYADSAQLGDLIVTGAGRFTNGLYGDLIGNADTATKTAKVADSGNGNDITLNYSGTNYSTTSWFAAWNGYQLGAISPANVLKTIGAVAKSGDTMTGTLTAPEFSLSGGVNDTIAGFRLTNNGTNMDMGWTWTGVQGAGACFTSSSHPNQPGIFDFFARAKNSSNQEVTKHLIGNISGVLTWDNRRVVTATNSTAVGGTSTPIYIDANGYAQACTSISATSATKATQDADGNTISSTYLKLSGGTVTGITQFNKTIRDSNGQHYFGGAANRTQWYVITLAHNGVTPPSTSAQWYMCSMSIHLAGDYQNAPNGTIELSYYIYWDKTEFHAINVYATGYGPNINKVNIYYNLANPFILYVDAANAYTTIWVDRVSYRDSAQSHNTKETKVQQSAAITVDDYSQIPIASIHTYNGTHLTTNSTFYPDVDNTHNLGTSDKKWSHIYATTFDGNLSGNASSASKLNSTRSFTVGNTAKNVDWSGAVSFSKAEISDDASSTANGWMSVADKKKLDSITVSDIGTIGANSIRGEKDIKVTISSGVATIGHENAAITAGTISGTATSTLSNGGSFKIPSITYDAYGHITGTTQTTVTLPSITSVSGNAGTATKFNSTRKIELTGDVTGSVSSDGSSGWSIGTTVNDYSHNHMPNNIVYNNMGLTNNIDPITRAYIGSAMSNKTFGLPANAITIEYSTNGGSTWIDYEATDSHKKNLFAETRTGCNTYLGKASTKEANSVNNQLRITIEPTDRYVGLDALYVWMSTNGNTVYVDLERSTIGAKDTFTTVFTNQQLSGWSGNNIKYFPYAAFGGGTTQTSNCYKYRLTFKQTAISSNYPSANIYDIRFLGGSWHSSSISMVQRNHLYSWDGDLNATFPANITATQFNGNATSATKDGSGNVITSTYAKLSGATFTGAINTANNTYNKIGDDVQIGDINVAGTLGIKGINGATGIRLVPYSGSTATDIHNDGAGNLTITGNIVGDATGTLGSTAKPFHQLVLGGATNATVDATSTNPRITFQEGTGTQPVHLIYSDYDNYRSPAGLKICGGASASPAWLEVEGTIYAPTFSGNATSATKAAQDGSGNVITSTYVNLTGTQTISGAKTFSTMISSSAGICVNSGGSGTAGGVSFWSDKTVENYGIALRTTANGGKHGFVQGDYATYNYIYAASDAASLTRGWVFKNNRVSKNVASIDAEGDAAFNGEVAIGTTGTNLSGSVSLVMDHDLNCLNFIFN